MNVNNTHTEPAYMLSVFHQLHCLVCPLLPPDDCQLTVFSHTSRWPSKLLSRIRCHRTRSRSTLCTVLTISARPYCVMQTRVWRGIRGIRGGAGCISVQILIG